MRRTLIAVLLISAFGCAPQHGRGDVPTPEQICRSFVEMVARERQSDQPLLGPASMRAKFEQCYEYNMALAAGEPKRYEVVVQCAKQQTTAVNWAVCGFRVEDAPPQI